MIPTKIDSEKPVGRPGIGPEREAEILGLRKSGKSATEIVKATGLSKTKVYEVLRLADRLAPNADQTGPGAAAEDRTGDGSKDTRGVV